MTKETLKLKVQRIANVSTDFKFNHQNPIKFAYGESDFTKQMICTQIAQACIDYLSED